MATLTTRMLKCECFECGNVARKARAHLAERGPDLCPCNGKPMRSYQWDEILAAEVAELHAADGTAQRPIRESWVTLRSLQECCRCHGELPHREYCHHAVYTVGGEFISEYTCSSCHPETASQYERGAMSYL